jgi:hypothetical protein
MTQIPVNIIYDQDGVTHGVCALDQTVIDTLRIIIPTKIDLLFKELGKDPLQDRYFFDKFCQFVVYFSYVHGVGMTLSFMDFGDNVDTALDDYLIRQDKGWSKGDRDAIINLSSKIRNDKAVQNGKLIVIVPMPPRPW